MLNFRQIDNKFSLSGGWVDVPSDIKWLKRCGFKGVLDLQFTTFDYNRASVLTIKEACNEVGIEYQALPLDDGPNDDIGTRFEVAYSTLLDWDTKFNNRNDKILVKCGAGVSRSVATLAYFFCRRDSRPYNEIKSLIQRTNYPYSYETMPISVDAFFEKWLKERFPANYEYPKE